MERFEKSGIFYSKFVVNERPYCLWDWQLPRANLEFIDDIDSDYFSYVAKVNSPLLFGADKHRAAVAIRIAYSLGLETFFALLFACLQAYDCVGGWFYKYQPGDLRTLIDKVRHRDTFYSKFEHSFSWRGITEVVFSKIIADQDVKISVFETFENLWGRFSLDFSNPQNTYEYNSLKHGLRVRAGGGTLKTGREKEPGVLADGERFYTMGSEFGTHFFVPEKLCEKKKNFRLNSASLFWHPQNLVHGLGMISVSIYNLKVFLKVQLASEAEDLSMIIPTREESQMPWQLHSSLNGLSMNPNIFLEHIKPFDSVEILKEYKSRIPLNQAPGKI